MEWVAVLMGTLLGVGVGGWLFTQRRHRTSRNAPCVVDHPELGTLRLSPERDSWEVTKTLEGREVTFAIGGSDGPDEKLIEHAVAIVDDFGAFCAMVEAFLRDEARAMPEVADEIATLKLEAITLSWPDRPDDGMLWFEGLEESYRIWRCDYVGRKPVGLGFDD